MVKKEAKTKKTAAKPAKSAQKEEPRDTKQSRYYEAKGGRKTAVARVRLFTSAQGDIVVNGKDFKDYFRDTHLQNEVLKPLETMNVRDKLGATVKVAGGGLRGQAEAVRHGIARALTIFNEDFRKRLRRSGFLTRDARMVERKKYGLRKARRAPQWAKR